MDETENECSIKLPRSLNGAFVSDLSDALHASRGHALTIDASNVEHVGGLCAQLLLSARKTWRAEDRKFRFCNATEHFVRDIELLGCQIDLFKEKEDVG